MHNVELNPWDPDFLQIVESLNIKNCSYVPLFGCFAQQNPNSLVSFNRLLSAFGFSTIIELGTLNGGFSTFFAIYSFMSKRKIVGEGSDDLSYLTDQHHSKQPCSFHTFDREYKDRNQLEFLTYLGARYEVVDFLNNPDDIQKISQLIEGPGRALLMCDGGNKVKEFEIYGKCLKKGDFIMAHDWAVDSNVFEFNKRNNIWHHAEITQKDIDPYLQEYKIASIFGKEFDKVAWFCGVKL